ncbi:hypothetical protein [Pseudonocardia sp.]|uniref:hypothetical protein n=1 Tax=Pseudonocardia sp. TaxID=60912 RepID=UPI0031FE0849
MTTTIAAIASRSGKASVIGSTTRELQVATVNTIARLSAPLVGTGERRRGRRTPLTRATSDKLSSNLGSLTDLRFHLSLHSGR